MRTLRIVVPAIGLGLALCGPSVATAQPGDTIVMSGLHNPRGLTFGPAHPNRSREHGGRAALYVAEAGSGGPQCTAQVRGPVCVGLSGSVSRYWHGHQQRIVEGLPSYAPFAPPSAGAVGPSDVSFAGGRGYVVIGLALPAPHVTIGPRQRLAAAKPLLLVHNMGTSVRVARRRGGNRCGPPHAPGARVSAAPH